MMKLEYFGRTCVAITKADIKQPEATVLINPEFTRNPDNFRNLDQIKADVIVLTKYQPKCIDDVVAIAKNNNSIIVANHGICGELEKLGIAKENLRRCFVGQKIVLFRYHLQLEFVPSLANSNIGGMVAVGVIVNWNNYKIYHDGYTAYYSDLKLLAEKNIDYALLTVSEYGSKDTEVAKKVIEDLKPKFWIPMMYSEYEKYKMNQFKAAMQEQCPETIGVLLDPNCSIIIEK